MAVERTAMALLRRKICQMIERRSRDTRCQTSTYERGYTDGLSRAVSMIDKIGIGWEPVDAEEAQDIINEIERMG